LLHDEQTRIGKQGKRECRGRFGRIREFLVIDGKLTV
jgi:hypothetical protein